MCLIASSVDHAGVRDDEGFVADVWARLRARFPACIVVFMPEANLGKEASHLERYVHADPLTVTMTEVREGWYGVHKSHVTTLEMHKKTAHLLARRALFVAADVVGVPTRDAARRNGLVAGSPAAGVYMVGQLRTQLRAFRWEPTGAKSALAEDVYRLTGKGNKRNDDLCVAFQMLWYWSQVFWGSARPAYTRAKALMRSGGGTAA